MTLKRPPTLLVALVAAMAIGVVLFVALNAMRGTPPASVADAGPSGDPVAAAQAAIAEDPDNVVALAALSDAALARAGETGDVSWYPRAEEAGRRALAVDPRSFDAMDALGTLALARHRFDEALQWSRRSLAVAPDRVRPLAIAADAQIETGRYGPGFAAAQRRLELRPDLPSYSRASYARELQGDRAGALRLMELAVGAAPLGSGDRAFAQVHVGLLLLGGGDAAAAERRMRLALAEAPGDPTATAGLAQVAASRGRLDEAAELYRRAIEIRPLPGYPAALAEIQAALGQTEAARASLAMAESMFDVETANGGDIDLDRAVIRADNGTPTTADVALARGGRDRRSGVVGDQSLGWVLTRAGLCAEGDRYATRSLRLGTQDALMLFHAGMAASCAGRPGVARTRLARALELNPAFSVRWAPVARRELARLTP